MTKLLQRGEEGRGREGRGGIGRACLEKKFLLL